MMNKNILCVIPARGGSKGVPYKNIKILDGKPLITYSIDVARQILSDDDICVSTEDQQIIDIVEKYGLKVPFVRPKKLATDQVGTYEVLLHALNQYKEQGKYYDVILLLQPTSPFRKKHHLEEALGLYSSDIDMVVSVKETAANPYFNLFEEDESGFLKYSKGNGEYTRRQDSPKVWEYNGSIYVINCASLLKNKMSKFALKKKYPMESIFSIDIDTPIDWVVAEEMIKMNLIK